MRVSTTADRSRPNTWRIRWTADGKRRSITWQGTESEAEETADHIAHLIVCESKGRPPHASTIVWLDGLPDGEYSKLVGIGGVEPRHHEGEHRPTVRELYDAFKAFKSDQKPTTLATYRRAWNAMKRHFGESRTLDSIDPIAAAEFVKWMKANGNDRDTTRTTLDRNTVRRRTGICRQMFRFAIKRGWIAENPFAELATTVSANPERFYYVSPGEYKRAIDFAQDATMRAVIALNRMIGLRVPSEIRTLKWSDVDLSHGDGHLRITATKTEHHDKRGIRTAPLLPDLRPYIQDLADLAEPGYTVPMDSPVFPRFTDASDSAIRSAVLKILKRAKVKPWPNLFSNGRKSAIIDLLAAGHDVVDVADWVGNSPKTIWDFYTFARAENRRRAASLPAPSDGKPEPPKTNDDQDDPECGPICGPKQAESGSRTGPQAIAKNEENPCFADDQGRQSTGQWALRDSNPRPLRCKWSALAKNTGNNGFSHRKWATILLLSHL